MEHFVCFLTGGAIVLGCAVGLAVAIIAGGAAVYFSGEGLKFLGRSTKKGLSRIPGWDRAARWLNIIFIAFASLAGVVFLIYLFEAIGCSVWGHS